MAEGAIDIAALGVKFDTTQVAEGTKVFNDNVQAGKALETQVNKVSGAEATLARAAREANVAHATVAATVSAETRAYAGLSAAQTAATGTSAGLRGAAMSLTRQLTGLGGASALAVDPVLALGGALGGALAPALLAVGLVVAGAAASFGLLHHELSKDFPKSVSAGLGLTSEQLERVEHDTVTMGDTFMATLDVIGAHIMDGPVGAGLKWLHKEWNQTLDAMALFAFETTARVVGFFVGSYRTITQQWRNFPAALGDAFAMATNLSLAAVEKLVNGSMAGLNAVLDAARKLPGLDWLPRVPEADLSRFKMQVSGAAETVGDAFANNITQATQETRKGLKAIGDEISAYAESRAINRVLAEAGKANKAAAPKATPKSEEEKQYDRILARSKDLTAQYEQEAATQKRLNDIVASGVMTMAEANRQYDLEKQIRPILAEADKVGGDRAAILLGYVQQLTAAYNALGQEKIRAELLQANTANRNEIDMLNMEIKLIGADTVVRARRLAVLKAEQELTAKGGFDHYAPTPDQKAFIDGRAAAAEATVDLHQKTDAYNDSLMLQIDLYAQLNGAASDLGATLGDAFGRGGKAIGDLIGLSTRYAGRQAEIAKAEADYRKQVGASNIDERRIAAFRDQSKSAQVRNYADLAGAAKTYFKEGTTGYKVLQAAEVAYRAIEFAMAVKSIFFKGAETAATVANAGVSVASDQATTASTVATSAIKSAAHGVVAIARAMASLPFPFNLAAGAATAAALVGFGVKVLGGGSGGSSVNVSEERQQRQGTGSVLGAANAKSESIAHALEIVASNTNHDLEYSNQMLKALRSIDTNIGALTNQLAQELNVGGALDTSGLGLGQTSKGPGLGTMLLTGGISALLPGLFGTKTSTTLLDQGLDLGSQSLGGILNGGLDASTYQQTQTTKKRKLFGIVVSNKTSQNTTNTALDGGVEQELQRVVASLRDGVLAAAGALGVQGAQATLDAFTVNLGKISFTGKTGEEIQTELEAVFSKLGDDLAAAAVPGLTDLQKAGEGAFETLARVAREYQVVDVALASIGKTFGATGLASVAARDNLVQLFGTMDDFASATQQFADDFLTDAERLAPVQKAVTDELARLGVSGVTTKEQFKALVLAQDLTTAAGQEMYASLLAVAPAFAKVIDAVKDGTKEINDARDALSAAYEREADALNGTIDRFRQFSASLSDFRESLYTGPAALLSPEAQYEASKAKFEDTSRRAALGDEKALGELQNVSQAYLDASKTYYASSGKYFQDLAAVRSAVESAEATATRTADNATAQLAALDASVQGLIEINESVLSVHDAIIQLQALLAGQTAAATSPFGTEATTQPIGAVTPSNDFGSGLVTTPTAYQSTPTPTAASPTASQPASDGGSLIQRLVDKVTAGNIAMAEAITETDSANTGKVVTALGQVGALERLKMGGIAA